MVAAPCSPRGTSPSTFRPLLGSGIRALAPRAPEGRVMAPGPRRLCSDPRHTLFDTRAMDYESGRAVSGGAIDAEPLAAAGHTIIVITARGLEKTWTTGSPSRGRSASRWGVTYHELRFGKPSRRRVHPTTADPTHLLATHEPPSRRRPRCRARPRDERRGDRAGPSAGAHCAWTSRRSRPLPRAAAGSVPCRRWRSSSGGEPAPGIGGRRCLHRDPHIARRRSPPFPDAPPVDTASMSCRPLAEAAHGPRDPLAGTAPWWTGPSRRAPRALGSGAHFRAWPAAGLSTLAEGLGLDVERRTPPRAPSESPEYAFLVPSLLPAPTGRPLSP